MEFLALAAPSAGSDATNPFEHPDALRRFRVINNQEELERAFEYPWEKWTIFLHPAQRQLVERDYNGPARVSGLATGRQSSHCTEPFIWPRKYLIPGYCSLRSRRSLSNALRAKLRQLISSEPLLGERIEVHAMNSIGQRLYEGHFGKPQFASTSAIRLLLQEASTSVQGNRFSLHFLLTEWEQVVDGWQLDTWEAYRDVARLGRKTRLKEPQRVLLWSIFEHVRSSLKTKGLITYSELFNRLASALAGGARSPFDFVVVDEAQDVSIAQLRFLAALGAERPNHFSSPEMWANGYFNNLSRGRRWASILEVVQPP